MSSNSASLSWLAGKFFDAVVSASKLVSVTLMTALSASALKIAVCAMRPLALNLAETTSPLASFFGSSSPPRWNR